MDDELIDTAIELDAPQDPVWGSRPPSPPPADSIARDTSCQGILALTLYRALQSTLETVNDRTVEETNECGKNQPNSHVSPIFGDEATDRIMGAFGRAVAGSQHFHHQQKHSQINLDGAPLPPSALLRGRLVSYNRHGTKWRLVVEHASLRPRHHRPKTLPKRERISLWNLPSPTIEGKEPENAVDSVSIPGMLEILAYNDIE
jgi:hypothetical protein